MHFYLVSLKNVPKALTYQSEKPVPIGSLVEVKVTGRNWNGIVLSEVEKPAYQCLPIQKVHVESALSASQIQLCEWMSEYYYCSLQRCLSLFIPSVVWNQKSQPKQRRWLKRNLSLEEAEKSLSRAPKQLETLKLFENDSPKRYEDIAQQSSSAIIKALIEKGALELTEGKLINPQRDSKSKPYHDQPLTQEQDVALKALLNADRKQRSFLLHGITGSGKTEIYLQMIKKQLEQGHQCLLLVPEIALTTELIQYFTEHFPDEISIIHSQLSDGERLQNWHRIHQGETKLILGSRSALFTPWQSLGLIIIDEEHEWTYKQDSTPRYHARRVAQQITQILDPKPLLLLGSATPSLESLTEIPEEQHLKLLKRATNKPLPPVHIVDLRDEFKKKNFSMFSETLQEAIGERLKQGEQSILFLNKRGASSSLTCRDCGYTAMCTDCSVAMTYHRQLLEFEGGGLICHYCGLYEELLTACPDCHSSAIRHIGSGTQKAEEQLQQLFPKARILRADKDTTSGKYDFETIYHQVRDGKADILIGTQMIAKGLDLPNVTLTGIIIADIGLHIPDFRASERVFQLLMQVAGRSGRHKPGEVIIQTYQPYHPAIQAIRNYDFEGFSKHELMTRKDLQYAPYTKSIKLIYAHENARIAADEAQKLYVKLESQDSNLIIDMAPHYIPRLHGKYVWNILIRGEEPRKILASTAIPKDWKIDVDPQ